MSVWPGSKQPSHENDGYVLWGLIAIELFMSFSFLGYIHIEPFSMTFVYIPVLIAGYMLGPGEAALVGMVFGLASMWKASAFYVGAGDAIFSPLASGRPWESLLLSVGTRTLFGWVEGLLYRAVGRGKHPAVGVFVVTTFGRSLHTFLVYGCMGLLFPEMGYTAADTLDEIFRWDFVPIALLTDLIVLGACSFLQSDLVRRILRRTKRQEPGRTLEAGKRRGIGPLIALALIACFCVAIYFTDRLGSVLSRYGIQLSGEVSYDMMHLQIQFLMGIISLASLVILGIVLYQKNQDYLYYEARLDGLTGLLSRRQFFQAGEAILRAADREPGKGSGCFIILDIDSFKKINDRYGHPAGDQVLRSVADCMRKEFGSRSILGRLGGDEFVALIHQPLSSQEMEKSLKHLRMTLEQIPIPEGRVTCSMGVIPVEPDQELEELYQRADRLLYEAKQKGKNQFVFGLPAE